MVEFRVAVTGAEGFIGSHLMARLGREEGLEAIAIGDGGFDSVEGLCRALSEADSVVHLAGVNRGSEQEVWQGNVGLMSDLLSAIGSAPRKVVFASSVQRENDNAYGRSKARAEVDLNDWVNDSVGGQGVTLVIPNVFGPGCKPFYNSAVATFCHQLAHGERPEILTDRVMELIHVDDLCEQIVALLLEGTRPGSFVERIRAPHNASVSEILAVLEGFKSAIIDDGMMPVPTSALGRDLLTTFISYLPQRHLSGSPSVHSDDRGRLFEVVRLEHGGQVFFSTTKPGVTRGGHYHTKKFERFFVVSGMARIRIRAMGSSKVQEFEIINPPGFVEIPPFHTHDITNIGQSDLMVVFWANELFDPDDPDTVAAPVVSSAEERTDQ